MLQTVNTMSRSTRAKETIPRTEKKYVQLLLRSHPWANDKWPLIGADIQPHILSFQKMNLLDIKQN